MQVTILGGGGFIGRKLAVRLAKDGTLGGRPVTSLTLFDIAAPPAPAGAGFPVRSLAGDIADPKQLAGAIPPGTEVIFHLAAVVSAAAEADWTLGLRVNLAGTLAVIEACRALPGTPRVVFTSSVASFAGGQGALVADDARQVPSNSYGAQKAAAELLLQDASRKGFLDGVSLRLPTIVVRPGRPNKAASSFVSAIVREPLLGLATELPVADDFALFVASPRRAVEWLLHAATMDTAPLGNDRGVNLPGLTVTVGEMLAALDDARPGAAGLVERRPDPVIAGIVSPWPARFTADRARALGFGAHEPMGEIVQAFVAEDLEPTRAERAA